VKVYEKKFAAFLISASMRGGSGYDFAEKNLLKRLKNIIF